MMCPHIRLRTALVYLTAGVTSSGLHCCKAMEMLPAGKRQVICNEGAGRVRGRA